MTGRVIHTGQVVIDLTLRIEAIPEPGGDVFADESSMAVGGGFNVLAAARRWEAGHDDAATDALFAPFRGRDLSDREKTDIVDLLRAHPALAEQLWRSAVMIATTRRAPTCPTTAAPASP